MTDVDINPEWDADVNSFFLLEKRRVIGFGETHFTNSNTRYVYLSSHHLERFASIIEDVTVNPGVWIGVTPGKPIIAKLDKDDTNALMLAPRTEPDEQ